MYDDSVTLVRIVKRSGDYDPDYYSAETVRVVKDTSDSDYYTAQKVRIVAPSSGDYDPDYYRAKKVRVIDDPSDSDYYRAKKVRIVRAGEIHTSSSRPAPRAAASSSCVLPLLAPILLLLTALL